MDYYTEDFAIIKENAILYYTYIPYRGKLKNCAEINTALIHARIALKEPKSGGIKYVPVNVDFKNKRIYIEERNFNCSWRNINKVIFHELKLRSYLNKSGIPLYSETDKWVDLSFFENESRRQCGFKTNRKTD